MCSCCYCCCAQKQNVPLIVKCSIYKGLIYDHSLCETIALEPPSGKRAITWQLDHLIIIDVKQGDKKPLNNHCYSSPFSWLMCFLGTQRMPGVTNKFMKNSHLLHTWNMTMNISEVIRCPVCSLRCKICREIIGNTSCIPNEIWLTCVSHYALHFNCLLLQKFWHTVVSITNCLFASLIISFTEVFSEWTGRIYVLERSC